RAMAAAEALDRDLAAGVIRGPLHAIPIGIKDIIDVAGLPTAAGSQLLREQIAAVDAPLVSRLRAAGAVILGKTVTTQFACYDPPVTRNPWNREQTPGGSSSGSAAAVAAGMCLAAIGSQTGGSITRPAAFCGVCGCKPSYGRVSLAGVVPLASSLDHMGPIARTVNDLAILLDVMAGPDPSDARSLTLPELRLSGGMQAGNMAAPRIGVLQNLYDKASPAAIQSIQQAAGWFRAADATVVDIPLPDAMTSVHRHHRTVMAAEAAAWHRERFERHPEDYQPRMAEFIQEGLGLQATAYVDAKEYQADAAAAINLVFCEVDVLICPSATGAAPGPETTGDPGFNSPWSFTGLPTVTVPCGLTEEGLPLGLQIIGPAGAETRLFPVAAWCEETLRQHLQPE
ncbi:MAG: amidase, partial [Planctomycetaceae bacterium]|nr:amidase [Planctomycetaceae bacterium]